MREARQVAADARAIAVQPGDAVRVGDDPRVWRVTRSSVEAMRLTLDLVPVTAGVGPRAADAGQVLSSPDALVGRSVAAVFELPPTGEEAWTRPHIAVAAAGDAPGWRQAAVEVSRDDGATWEPLGTSAAAAVMGVTSAAVRRGSATLIDRAGVVELALLHDGMALQSADAAMRARGANLALLGDEVIQFAQAVQVAPARWQLSLLERGMNGSVAQAHAAGTRFVALDRDSLLVPDVALRIGERMRVGVRGVGDVDGPVVAETMLTGRSVAPLAPVHLRWHALADGGARVTWVRRSRLGWRWDDGDVPLGEERERYRVTVTSAIGTRVLLTDEPAAAVSRDECAGDGVRVAISQIGTVASSPEVIITRGNQS
jgi:hypothetical protein